MKNNFTPFARIAALVACVMALGSCSRSEYAMLPKGPAYQGTTRVAMSVRTAPVAATAAPVPAVAAPAVVPTVAATPAAQPTAVASAQVPAAAAPSAVATTKAPHLNLVQRLAVRQLANKVDKLTRKSGTARQHDNTAATQKLEGRLRQGIILAAIGLLVEILGAVVGSGLVYLLGAILIIVGGVFILLYLIDKL